MNIRESELAEGQRGLATLERFYKAESAYLVAGGGDFSGIAATLDPDCVIYQPASLPYGGAWRGYSGVEAWMKAFTREWSALEVRGSEFIRMGTLSSANRMFMQLRGRPGGSWTGRYCSSSGCVTTKS